MQKNGSIKICEEADREKGSSKYALECLMQKHTPGGNFSIDIKLFLILLFKCLLYPL